MTNKHLATVSVAFMSMVFVSPAIGFAQEGKMCETSQKLDSQRLLRRISLDLRQKVPAYEELLDVKGQEDVPERTVDRFLDSADFSAVM